jgi:hypothetical protein
MMFIGNRRSPVKFFQYKTSNQLLVFFGSPSGPLRDSFGISRSGPEAIPKESRRKYEFGALFPFRIEQKDEKATRRLGFGVLEQSCQW